MTKFLQLSFFMLLGTFLVSCNSCEQANIQDPEEIYRHDLKEKEPIVESERIAFLTRQLNLSPEEAKLFWPVFDKYMQLKNDLWRTQQNLLFKTRPRVKVSRELAQETLDSLLIVQEQIHQNDKEFTSEMLKILPPEKVLLLQHAEHHFKRHLLQKIRGQRGKGIQ